MKFLFGEEKHAEKLGDCLLDTYREQLQRSWQNQLFPLERALGRVCGRLYFKLIVKSILGYHMVPDLTASPAVGIIMGSQEREN